MFDWKSHILKSTYMELRNEETKQNILKLNSLPFTY